MRKLILMAAVAFSSAAAAIPPVPPPPPPAPPPRLVIVISVDQFSADLFDEYRPQFTAGLARLSGGTVYRNGFQSHATTETCPGHSTILTGDRPARTGIVSNAWAAWSAPRADKTAYCAEDERVPGSTSTKYIVSPFHLRVPTLGDLMKSAFPGSLNVAVSGKDRSAVMMSGHSPDQRWYWDDKQFATDLKAAPVPSVVTLTNQAMAQVIAEGAPGLQPNPYCASKAQIFPLEGGGKPVGNGTLARAPGDAGALRASPQMDGAVLALAAALVQQMKLGRDTIPDILSVGLSATDYVGHSYGPGGQEMCLQLIELDREIGDFLAQLDRWNLDYAVVLTADHGGLDIPERLRAKGVVDAARIDASLTPKAISAEVSRETGITGPILADVGVVGDLYLDPQLKARDRPRALAAAVAAYRRQPQVAAAFTKDEIARTAIPVDDPVQWSLIERVRASFDPERSGDLYVVLKPHVMPISDTTSYVATHGSPWDYDRRVPILVWRNGFRGTTIEVSAETADIMPTLAAMLGLPLAPGAVDGQCLGGAPGVACPP